MSDLRRLFANPFQHAIIGDEALRSFTYDHLQRLAVINGSGKYSARLTDTVTVYCAFGGGISAMELKRQLQIVTAGEMYMRWNSFRDWMSHEGEARIANKAGRESALHRQFFPQGVEELGRAILPQAAGILNRMAWLVTGDFAINGRLIGQEFVTKLLDFRRDFDVARWAHDSLIGESSAPPDLAAEDEESLSARAGLEVQLFDNLLAILQEHRREPNRALEYFNLALLEYPVLTKGTQRVPAGFATAK